jgi:hypothetical protein
MSTGRKLNMASVRCTVSLLSDKNRKVDIEISKGKDNQPLWKIIKSSGGSLRLSADDGTWEVFANLLLFWYETTGAERKKMVPGYTKLPTLAIRAMKDDFMDDIVNNGNVIDTDEATLYNANPSEEKVSCKLARMN